MRRIVLSALAVLCALPLLSCSGGDESPTDPGELTRNLVIKFVIDNAAGVQTITTARLLFDNQLIDRYQGAAARAVGFNTVVERVSPGQHTVAFAVEHAAQGAVFYRMGVPAANTVSVSIPPASTSTVIILPSEQLALTSGQVREYRIQIP